MTVQHFDRRPRRRSRRRPVLWALAVVLLLGAAPPQPPSSPGPRSALGADADALASIEQPTYAGSVEQVAVHTSGGKAVAVDLRNGQLWPRRAVPAGEQLTVDVTVKRPAWAGWLVGHTAHTTFHVVTPSAALRGRWLEVPAGKPVTISFDQPVQRVVLRDERGLAHSGSRIRARTSRSASWRAELDEPASSPSAPPHGAGSDSRNPHV